MKTLLKILGAIVIVLLLLIAGVYGWASFTAKRALSKTYAAHAVDFPVPFPLTAEEIAKEGFDAKAADSAAMARAIERGGHLLASRYACGECHGKNFAGGTMVDAFPLGRLLGPNLTLGKGSRTLNYTANFWDHIVRHGILPDGRPAVMPSEDFQKMSDQELSDIVAFIRSKPAVDTTVPKSSFGPLGRVLIATGQLTPSASRIASHDAPHEALPPAPVADAAFGAHLAGTCTGCHGANLAGGPIPGGDPKWPPARNLTPHASGTGAWTFEEFRAVMTSGVRRDGSVLKMPMTIVVPYAQNMTEAELGALWAYLRSLPPVDHAIP
jgi:mono/diheme cytochrome c family protein